VGLRSTPQRLAILREVFSRSHPTVAEIYESVRSRFPTIGLQTVYNTLHTMTQRGIVTELSFSSATRFDSNTKPHANLVCRNCGGIEDAEFASDHFEAMLRRVIQPTGFARDGQRIDVYGLCMTCATSKSASPSACAGATVTDSA